MSLFKAQNSGIKALATIILLAVPAYLFNRCEDEKAQARSYPQVRTNPVSNITSNGATFNADIYSPGAELMTDHGFVWSEGDNPDLTNNKVRLGSGSPAGAYRAEIVTSLSKDVEYTVKAFIQTTGHVVYGLPVKFISLGSGAPVVKGFEPDSAAWLDTVIVKGTNFSWIKDENIVRLGQTQCIVLSATDTSLSFIVNKDVPEIKSVLSLEISGNKIIYTKTTFKLIVPVIKSFFPPEAGWGDTLTLIGENFESAHVNAYNVISASINGFQSTIIDRKMESLSILMPYQLNSLDNPIIIKFNKLSIQAPKNVTLKSPVIYGIYPKEGAVGDVITLKGKFHPERARNTISVGSVNNCFIGSNSKDSISIYTGDLTDVQNLVILHSDPFTVISPDTFKLLPPFIESINILTGISGSVVSIHGNYFVQNPNVNPRVEFGSEEAVISTFDRSIINFIVPFQTNLNPKYITVIVGSQNTTYKDPFTILTPEITNIYPLTGNFEDQITIEGTNLPFYNNYLDVYFTDIGENPKRVIAHINQDTPTKIVISVSPILDSIPKYIEISDNTHIHSVYSQQNFVLNPPEFIAVYPTSFTAGMTLSISGNNFSPYWGWNKVYWGDYELPEYAYPSLTQIVVTVPASVPLGTNRICVKTGGYKRYSSLYYERY